MEKHKYFSSTLKRLKSTRRLTLTFWRRRCCQNAAVCIQTMISSSCKTALHHTAPKQLKIFFETTRPISVAHKNGHRIRQICIRYRLLSLGYFARTCLRRKARTICESQRPSECYQRQMARCRWPDSQKSYIAVEKAFLAAVGKQNGGPIQHLFCWSVDWYELLWRSV